MNLIFCHNNTGNYRLISSFTEFINECLIISKRKLKTKNNAPQQGVAMLSSVLNSNKSIDVNISIMRVFVALRQHLTDYNNLKEHIAHLEKEMNIKFKDIHQALNFLRQKDKRTKYRLNSRIESESL